MTRWMWPCLVVGAVLGLGVGVTAAATPATAITACVHRVNQNVRIVSGPTECRSFETPASWPSAGPQGGASLSGPAGSLSVSVVDATGQKLGDTIRLAGNSATVLLTLDGVLFPLDVTPQGFKFSKDSAGGNLIFVGSGDCTGPAYYATDRYFPPLTVAVVGPPGTTLYLLDETRADAPVAVQGSHFVQSGDRWMCYAYYGWGSGSLVPVESRFDLNTLFTPPFSVQ